MDKRIKLDNYVIFYRKEEENFLFYNLKYRLREINYRPPEIPFPLWENGRDGKG
jgi:hypothetical protein